MKTTVIHHSADMDGLFCREIARKFLPDAELLGWDFGDDPIKTLPEDAQYYVLDLPVDKPFGWGLRPDMDPYPYRNIIWIDHHKSAIESHPKDIPGYRIDGVAACRLAWQWFTQSHNGQAGLPEKLSFLDRVVIEPLAVRLAGEYDIWDKRDPRAELFQHGLRSRELKLVHWNAMLQNHDDGDRFVEHLLEDGEAVQYAQTKQNEDIITHYGFTIQFEGLTFLACNHARYNSHLFTAGLKPEHDACLGFKYNGKGKWEVSLYHAPGKEHHDLSLIAVKHGGGGHRGACGFVTDALPFLK